MMEKFLAMLPAPVAMLLLPAPEKPKRELVVQMLHVPAGHVTEDGEVIKNPFKVQLEAGIRWHPDWPEPRAHLRAILWLWHGDAVIWDGEDAIADFGSLMDAPVRRIGELHGHGINRELRKLVAELGLIIPDRRSLLSHFISTPPMRRRTV